MNLRGVGQSEEATYIQDMKEAMDRKLPVAVHASQAPPNVVDAEVVVDGNLVTSRQPQDIPAFIQESLKMLQKVPAGR